MSLTTLKTLKTLKTQTTLITPQKKTIFYSFLTKLFSLSTKLFRYLPKN